MSGPVPSRVRICLLGGFRVTVDGVPAEGRWRLRKAQTLVKLLAVTPGHRVHRDVLTETLHPGRDPAAAANNLHQELHAARRVLGADRLLLADNVVALAPEIVVDVDEFEAAARDENDVEGMRAALDMWGDPLVEDAYEQWAAPLRARLLEMHGSLVNRLAAALVARGEAGRAVALLEAVVVDRPLDEAMHRTLFAAYVAAGRRLDGVAAYERLRDAVDREYASELDPETKAVYRRLLATGTPGSSVAHNLPAPTTSFVGRRRELAELERLLERTRLLTLTGPGGAGKTRLAIELARRVGATSAEHPDGIWLVEFAGLREGGLIVSAVAAALDVGLPGDLPSAETLARQLVSRRLLLILDNCEHVLDETAEIVSTLLPRCPGLSVVTTSREPLRAPGELVWRVPAMELPSSNDESAAQLARLEAVQLFVERARDAVPAFALDASTAPAVARICYRLDGIPLAVELAAARLAHLSVTQLADRLGQLLVLLAHRGRGRLDRQQTLAATLDWSHDLLADDERVLFRRLAVFAGGFDLESVAEVCGAGLPGAEAVLARLVDKSLVNADTGGDQARYRMLEVVRQYAETRLVGAGELADCRRAHRRWFAQGAAAHDPDRAGPVAREPSTWFDREHDNLRAALASALEEEPALALQLAVCTWRFWLSRGQIADGLRWLALVLEACPESSTTRSRALFATGVLQIRRGNGEPLRRISDEITAIHRRHGDATDYADAVHMSAVFAYMRGEHDRARRLAAETERLAGAVPTVLASSKHFTGLMAFRRGDTSARSCLDLALAVLDKVRTTTPPFFTAVSPGLAVGWHDGLLLPYIEQTILHGRRIGAQQARAHVLMSLALVDRAEGRIDESLRLVEDAREICASIEDRYGEGSALLQRAHALRSAGRWDESRAAFGLASALFADLRHQRLIAVALAGRALLEAAVGESGDARRLAEEATRLMERSGDRPGVWYGRTSAALVEVLLGEYDGAIHALDRAPDSRQIPGGHMFTGWQVLLRGRLMQRCGRPDEADEAVRCARDLFTEYGDTRGLAALDGDAKTLQSVFGYVAGGR